MVKIYGQGTSRSAYRRLVTDKVYYIHGWAKIRVSITIVHCTDANYVSINKKGPAKQGLGGTEMDKLAGVYPLSPEL